jgi:hypothetical protein
MMVGMDENPYQSPQASQPSDSKMQPVSAIRRLASWPFLLFAIGFFPTSLLVLVSFIIVAICGESTRDDIPYVGFYVVLLVISAASGWIGLRLRGYFRKS